MVEVVEAEIAVSFVLAGLGCLLEKFHTLGGVFGKFGGEGVEYAEFHGTTRGIDQLEALLGELRIVDFMIYGQ